MHLKKRMTFHGVEYIVVPVELWDGLKDWTSSCSDEGWEGAREVLRKCYDYEHIESPELTDE